MWGGNPYNSQRPSEREREILEEYSHFNIINNILIYYIVYSGLNQFYKVYRELTAALITFLNKYKYLKIYIYLTLG